MLHIELPHVNVLSKIDILENYGELPFSLEFFTDVGDMRYLLDLLDADPATRRMSTLNAKLCELVEDFPYTRFYTLNIEDKDSVLAVVKVVDKANGYIFADLDAARAQLERGVQGRGGVQGRPA
mmetsp:Transcript_23642/g.62604  ORF Transcript_23642/g.62604 Transcript_23642/m.62604 type:complete len:124 (+) Transcript_23642:438-809(+)